MNNHDLSFLSFLFAGISLLGAVGDQMIRSFLDMIQKFGLSC